MADHDQIARRVVDVVREVLCIEGEDPALDSAIVDDLQASSLDQVSLFMALEDEFGGAIPEAELEQLVTLRDVVNYVDTQIGALATT